MKFFKNLNRNKVIIDMNDYVVTTMGNIPVIKFNSDYFTKNDVVRVIDAIKNGYALRDTKNGLPK